MSYVHKTMRISVYDKYSVKSSIHVICAMWSTRFDQQTYNSVLSIRLKTVNIHSILSYIYTIR